MRTVPRSGRGPAASDRLGGVNADDFLVESPPLAESSPACCHPCATPRPAAPCHGRCAVCRARQRKRARPVSVIGSSDRFRRTERTSRQRGLAHRGNSCKYQSARSFASISGEIHRIGKGTWQSAGEIDRSSCRLITDARIGAAVQIDHLGFGNPSLRAWPAVVRITAAPVRPHPAHHPAAIGIR